MARMKEVAKVSALCLLVLTLACACASDVANRYYGDVKYPPKKSKEVEVIYVAPASSYTVIADFQSRNESVDSLRKKAGKIGADAIIISRLGGYAALNSEWASDDPYPNTGSRVVGTAIKYSEASP